MPAPPRPSGWRPNPSGLLALAVVLAAVIGTWWVSGGDPGTPTGSPPATSSPAPSAQDGASQAARPSSSPGRSDGPRTGQTDPASGLRWVEVGDLPPQARATLDLVDAGGPFPYDQDGSTFENREGILPDEPRGYYAEYTVETPGSPDRGARRLVTGDGGEVYWTEDHYDSFERVAR